MGWRSRFIFLLIVYFAGFATAVYCLVPAPEGPERRPLKAGDVRSAVQSEKWAQSVNSGIHKCVDLGKEAALEAARRIREKMQEAQAQRSQ